MVNPLRDKRDYHAAASAGLETSFMAYPPNWDDMSEYVVHFTKATDNADQYQNIMSILWDRVLRPGRAFGIARSVAPTPDSQNAVCFSEIPLRLLSRIADRRGAYGIGFAKDLVLQRGAGPIWYVEKDGPAHLALQQLMARAQEEPTDPVWDITPLIDAPGNYPSGAYRFEWEREWRYVGDFSYREDDVAFLIIPEEHHVAARGFFENAVHEHTGPGYICPYVDPWWNHVQVQQVFDTLAGPP